MQRGGTSALSPVIAHELERFIHCPVLSRGIFAQVISLKLTKRARRNGPKAMRRHGKPPCVTSPQASIFFLSPLFHFIRVTGPSAETPHITKSIVNHVQTSLARAPYNIDDFGAYQAASLSVRDNLIVSYDLLDCFKIPSRLLPTLTTGQLSSIIHHAHFYFSFPIRDSSQFSSFVSVIAPCINEYDMFES